MFIQPVTHIPVDRPPLDGCPLFTCPAVCGFPSPAEDYVEGSLDLHCHLVRNKHATFFVRAAGESMVDAGIHDGDLLVVDRSVDAQDGSIIVAAVNGELTVKRLRIQKGRKLILEPANPTFDVIEVDPDGLCVWGVVQHAIHSFTR